MSYVLNTPADQREMLKAIGVASIDELFSPVPESVRFKGKLQVPPALSEMPMTDEMVRLAKKNISPDEAVCFLGGGSYDHFIPAVVDQVAGRGEFYTAYTPYQAEASQGSLQAFFEFQTLICQLTGMDVANASLYEAGSGVTEAALMAHASVDGRKIILMPESVHPEYRQTLDTYLENLDPVVKVLPTPEGVLKAETLNAALDESVSCLVLQSPNFFGNLEEVEALTKQAQAKGVIVVIVTDPVGLGVLKRPGDYGADIVVAEGQGLGTPMQYGGPFLGLLACKNQFIRKIPGRLVGQTTDKNGKTCWSLTLQTREQHIRRDKATSNICSNQGLIALRATVHLAALGPVGLKETAELCVQKAHYAASELAKVPGIKLKHSGKPFFKEFTIELPTAAEPVLAKLLQRGYHAGLPLSRWYPSMPNCVTVAVTEKRTKAEIDGLVAAYRAVIAG
ncbi:MAG: aminomethyl-transferring glycine dehydrogenase subunit GcvPA [Gemmatales bacterium]